MLRRLRTIEGRILDRKGRPLAGAGLPVGRRPDAHRGPRRSGRSVRPPWRIRGAGDRPRPQGRIPPGFQPVNDGGAPIQIELARVNEAPITAYKTLPPALTADEEKVLARRLVQAEAGRVLARGGDQAKFVFLTNLAALDPADALERLEAARFADPGDADSIRRAAAEALARENLDEGLAVVETLKTPEQRAHGYLAVLQPQPDLEPARARQIIDQAIVNARSPSNEWQKIYLLEQIAGRLLDLGEIERAKPLIREGEELARKTLRDKMLANRLASFAGLMLRVDPAAALPKFEELRRQIDGGQVTVRTPWPRWAL